MEESIELNVGQNITKKSGCWSFDGNVPDVFESHIRKSIPGYDFGHEIVCKMSDFFCLQDSLCYEIGTSTGALIKKLAVRHKLSKPKIRWIGIDNIDDMLNVANKNILGIDNIELINSDVRDYVFDKSDFIVSYYAIQFIPPRDRQTLINTIYSSLNWGGAFVWFEKVRAPDARFQDILNNMYINFKLSQGFTPEEIISKAESLKTVLEPFSTQGNYDLLSRAGFKDIMTIYRNICFEGVVCIK